jgi:hypothetical protein
MPDGNNDPQPGPAIPDGIDFAKPMPEPVQTLAAELRNREASLWIFELPEVQERWRSLIESGYRCLAADPPNVAAATEILERVETAISSRVETSRRNRQWQMIGAATLAILLVVMLTLSGFPWSRKAIVGIPMWAFFLGAAGGAASGLVNLRNPISILGHRQFTLVAALSRAFLGAVTGALAYALFSSGIVAITTASDTGATTQLKTRLFLAFVVLAGGYSERLLGSLAARAETLVAGANEGEAAARR